MVHRIYYFSGTGNSLWVARKIQESFPEIELIPITRDLPAELAAEAAAQDTNPPLVLESVGLVFPIYMSKPPLIVFDFIRKMPKSDYIYAVATCGMMPGLALTSLKNYLLKYGHSLSAGYIVPLVSNFIVLPKTKSDAAIEKAFLNAEAKTQIIAQNISKKTSHYDKETPKIIAKPVSWFLFNPLYRRIPRLDKRFTVNDNCNNCGTCRDVCPVRNVKLTASKPIFLHECEMCFSCINWCPQKAINWTPVTKNKKRYRCKGITKKEIVSNRYYKITENDD